MYIMFSICKDCDREIQPDRNGNWVDIIGDPNCPVSSGSHTPEA
jgi:hypothetical protein